MATGHHLQKWKNHDISATALPIFMKFGTVMQLGPLQLNGH